MNPTRTPPRSPPWCLTAVAAWFFATGCATYTTLPLLYLAQAPKVFVGTRLDVHAIRGDEERLREYDGKYRVTPPAQPKADLPLSLIADTILFPFVAPVSLYEALFE
jgi:uncharacterized protein YceK